MTRELDRKFDAGEDISQLLDLSKAKRPQRERQQRLGKDRVLLKSYL
ncbi:MAG: hypothetical protein AB4352_25515 [Hormoscilla sp.]